MRAVWGMTFLLAASAACSDTTQPSPVDAGVDAGPDAGMPDAGLPDAGRPDAGPPDAGRPDAGPPDAGRPDAGPPDAGAADAGWAGMWQTLGSPLGHEAQVYPAMALDGSGAPLVAYAELVESPGIVATELHVVRWSGTSWEPLGGTVASSTDRLPYTAPLFVRLATDGAGNPVLAFGDSGPGATVGAFPLQTWSFDGTAWKALPVPVTAPQLSGIALEEANDGHVRLVLATGHELRVLVLGSSGWSQAFLPLVDDAGVSEPDLALSGDGAPLLAFSAAASPGSFGSLRAFRWRDGGWSDLRLPSPEGAGLLFHSPRIPRADRWRAGRRRIGVAVRRDQQAPDGRGRAGVRTGRGRVVRAGAGRSAGRLRPERAHPRIAGGPPAVERRPGGGLHRGRWRRLTPGPGGPRIGGTRADPRRAGRRNAPPPARRQPPGRRGDAGQSGDWPRPGGRRTGADPPLHRHAGLEEQCAGLAPGAQRSWSVGRRRISFTLTCGGWLTA